MDNSKRPDGFSHSESLDWIFSRAINDFELKRPRWTHFAKNVAVDMPARQPLYRSNGLQLDVKVEFESEGGGIIIGQLLSELDTETIPAGLRVNLMERGQKIRSSATNRLGEFVFEGLRRGNYEIQIALSGKLVRMPVKVGLSPRPWMVCAK